MKIWFSWNAVGFWCVTSTHVVSRRPCYLFIYPMQPCYLFIYPMLSIPPQCKAGVAPAAGDGPFASGGSCPCEGCQRAPQNLPWRPSNHKGFGSLFRLHRLHRLYGKRNGSTSLAYFNWKNWKLKRNFQNNFRNFIEIFFCDTCIMNAWLFYLLFNISLLE